MWRQWWLPMVALVLASPCAAFDGAPAAEKVSLEVGRGTIVDCPQGVERVATTSPETVDVVVTSDREVLFHAKALGQATLVVWSKGGERRAYEVTVEPNLEPLRTLLKASFPDDDIQVRATRDSVVLVGRVKTQWVADQALALLASAAKGAVSHLQVATPQVEKQVLLRVRFAELNRSASQQFGINLLSTGALRTIGGVGTGQFPSGSLSGVSGTIPASGSSTTSFTLSDMLNIFAFRPDLNLGMLITDLAPRGQLQILAEPNLVATDGKEASFLAGGEFPVPVVQGGATAGAVTVQFREYGIRLTFLPRITANRTIRLHVKPEVSTIDLANGVTVSGFRIPALSTQRVETDVELVEGQSFAIAGMLNQQVTQNLARLPGLASVPVLGALFRTRAITKAQTELVVIVTPEIVTALDRPPDLPPMPIPFMGPATLGGKSK
jgi:pilus assembly protein CpaC